MIVTLTPTSVSLRSDNTDLKDSTILNENLKIFDTREYLRDGYENITPNFENDPTNTTKNIKKKMNTGRIITAYLKINFIRNKFDALKTIVNGNIVILLITETLYDVYTYC